jgi:hypothetical protein
MSILKEKLSLASRTIQGPKGRNDPSAVGSDYRHTGLEVKKESLDRLRSVIVTIITRRGLINSIPQSPQLATKRASSPKDIAFPKQLAILTDSASINRYHSQRRNVAATPTNKAPKRRHSGKPSKATTRPGRELQCNRAVTSSHFWNRAAPTRKVTKEEADKGPLRPIIQRR